MTILWWMAVVALCAGSFAALYSAVGGGEGKTSKPSSVQSRLGALFIVAPFFIALWMIVLRGKP